MYSIKRIKLVRSINVQEDRKIKITLVRSDLAGGPKRQYSYNSQEIGRGLLLR